MSGGLRPLRQCANNQQSSVGRGQRHHPRRPGQPAFPAGGSPPFRPTDDAHCSLLTPFLAGVSLLTPFGSHFSVRDAPSLLLAHAPIPLRACALPVEHAPALRVVAEHVELEHAGAARPYVSEVTRTPFAPPRTCPPRRAPSRGPRRITYQRPRLADRNDRGVRDASGSTRSPKSPPLNLHPDRHGPSSKLSIAHRAASIFVAFSR